MKKLIFTCIILLIQFVFSQEKYKNVVEVTKNAINSKSVTELEKYLSSDFEISGQKGLIARKVLPILVKQLDEKVTNIKEISTKKESDKLIVIYEFTYKKKGKKTTTFIFNNQGQLKSLELFKMQVKTMSLKDTKIKLPTQNVIEIPFKKIGKLIAVEVMVDGLKRTFLLDSGSPKVVINSHYRSKPKETLTSVNGVNGNVSSMDIEIVKEIEFFGITMKNQKVLTSDMSHIEKSKGVDFQLYGLIGYEMIKDYDLLFDYKNSKLILIKPEYFEEFKRLNLSDNKFDKVSIELSKHIPVFEAQIGNEMYNFGLDSGAEANLISSQLLSKLSNEIINQEKSSLRGIGKEVKSIKAKIKKIVVGTLKRGENVELNYIQAIEQYGYQEKRQDNFIEYTRI